MIRLEDRDMKYGTMDRGNYDTIGIFGLSRRKKETWASIVIQGIKPGMEKIV